MRLQNPYFVGGTAVVIVVVCMYIFSNQTPFLAIDSNETSSSMSELSTKPVSTQNPATIDDIRPQFQAQERTNEALLDAISGLSDRMDNLQKQLSRLDVEPTEEEESEEDQEPIDLTEEAKLRSEEAQQLVEEFYHGQGEANNWSIDLEYKLNEMMSSFEEYPGEVSCQASICRLASEGHNVESKGKLMKAITDGRFGDINGYSHNIVSPDGTMTVVTYLSEPGAWNNHIQEP